MKTKINYKNLIISIIMPLAVGGLSALLTKSGFKDYNNVAKPVFSPPSILFPIVWTILYILMGVAFFLVITSNINKLKLGAVISYGLQLIFNFFWTIIFFVTKNYLFAFVWLNLMLLLIIITTVIFYKINKKSAYLLVPYIIWTSFAGVLNYFVFTLN